MFKDLSYVEKPVSKSQSLDLYVPTLKDGGKAPLVIWIHGGGWRGGDKDAGPFQALIREGFAVASINYRLSWEAIYPAQYEDCVSAVRWLVANADKYNIDSSRIGMWGASAGGHLSALVGLRAGHTSDVKDLKIKAVCDWFGPVDLPLIIKDKQEAGQSAEIVGQLIGGPDNLKLAAEASPVTYVHKGGPPFLIMHGSADNLVPIKQSEVLQQKLKDAGVKTQLEVIQGGHGFPGFGWETIKKVVDFFKENLG